MLASCCLAQLAFASTNDIRAVAGYRCLSCAMHKGTFSRCVLSCAWWDVRTSSQPKTSSSLCAAARLRAVHAADTERLQCVTASAPPCTYVHKQQSCKECKP